MRPIKFRAWDKEKKEMQYPKTFFTFDYESGEVALDNKHWAEREVMQFTGLLDKNGKNEIYEGDLVKYGGSIYEVYWENGHFMGCNELWTENDKCEVIGNIHENPELLTLPPIKNINLK